MTKKPRVKLICKKCGNIFEVEYRRKDTALYCSKSCHSSAKMKGGGAPWWKGGDDEHICRHCGKSFFASRSTRRVYCSKKCLDEARMNRVILTCTVCGKKYEEKASRANRYIRSFCSLKCRYTLISGSTSPTWRGGISFAPYPITFNNKFKRMIRERDNNTCQVCNKRGNHVHHINYIKDDTIPDNCITLCRSCHMKTNANREYWQDRLRAIMHSHS